MSQIDAMRKAAARLTVASLENEELRRKNEELKGALRALLAWSDRMPDAGLTDDDPRRAWWFERPAEQARATLAAEEER